MSNGNVGTDDVFIQTFYSIPNANVDADYHVIQIVTKHKCKYRYRWLYPPKYLSNVKW